MQTGILCRRAIPSRREQLVTRTARPIRLRAPHQILLLSSPILGATGKSQLTIRGAIAALGIEARRIEESAERFRDWHEGILLHNVALRMRTAQCRLEGEIK